MLCHAEVVTWQKAFGSLALAEATSGTWTFKRSGFLRPKVTVRVPESDTEVAVFAAGWGGEGTLSLSNGRSYHWQSTNFWQSKWAFTNEAGEPIVQFKAEFAFLKLSAEVNVEPVAVALPDLSLLAVLGWYLMVLLSDDTAGAAAGGAAG